MALVAQEDALSSCPNTVIAFSGQVTCQRCGLSLLYNKWHAPLIMGPHPITFIL